MPEVNALRTIRLQIDDARCRICRRCLAAQVCKVRAIVRLERDAPPYLDVGRCYDCRLCLPACPFGAISVAQQNRERHQYRSHRG